MGRGCGAVRGASGSRMATGAGKKTPGNRNDSEFGAPGSRPGSAQLRAASRENERRRASRPERVTRILGPHACDSPPGPPPPSRLPSRLAGRLAGEGPPAERAGPAKRSHARLQGLARPAGREWTSRPKRSGPGPGLAGPKGRAGP
jgi:hypothetical protein